MREIIYSDTFKSFLGDLTGIELNDVIALSGSKYRKGNTLLCHDDELEGRRIAYIYYLVPEDWSEEDGGTLDLYSVDDTDQPAEIVEKVVPKRNALIFFEVSPISYHRVGL